MGTNVQNALVKVNIRWISVTLYIKHVSDHSAPRVIEHTINPLFSNITYQAMRVPYEGKSKKAFEQIQFKKVLHS